MRSIRQSSIFFLWFSFFSRLLITRYRSSVLSPCIASFCSLAFLFSFLKCIYEHFTFFIMCLLLTRYICYLSIEFLVHILFNHIPLFYRVSVTFFLSYVQFTSFIPFTFTPFPIIRLYPLTLFLSLTCLFIFTCPDHYLYFVSITSAFAFHPPMFSCSVVFNGSTFRFYHQTLFM